MGSKYQLVDMSSEPFQMQPVHLFVGLILSFCLGALRFLSFFREYSVITTLLKQLTRYLVTFKAVKHERIILSLHVHVPCLFPVNTLVADVKMRGNVCFRQQINQEVFFFFPLGGAASFRSIIFCQFYDFQIPTDSSSNFFTVAYTIKHLNNKKLVNYCSINFPHGSLLQNFLIAM